MDNDIRIAKSVGCATIFRALQDAQKDLADLNDIPNMKQWQKVKDDAINFFETNRLDDFIRDWMLNLSADYFRRNYKNIKIDRISEVLYAENIIV